MQQSKPCPGAGIYGRKLFRKTEHTMLNYIGEGIQQFQDDVNWTSDKIQEILMLSCLQSYSDRHNICHFETTITNWKITDSGTCHGFDERA